MIEQLHLDVGGQYRIRMRHNGVQATYGDLLVDLGARTVRFDALEGAFELLDLKLVIGEESRVLVTLDGWPEPRWIRVGVVDEMRAIA